ncbi:MAG: hypothetical protein ACRD4T_09040 [Candidatus Acidiferrales bacterium]
MVAANGSSKVKQVATFLRSFAPQQWGQLLFVFGALALFCAPFASWSPPFPLPGQPWEVPSPPSSFFEHIPPYSADSGVLAWKTWHRFLLIPQILLFAAGLLALAFSFAPSELFRRRRWSWVYATCLLAVGVIWIRLLLWTLGSGSVLETTGQRLSKFCWAVPDLAIGMGPGLQLLSAGLLLLGIGSSRVRRGAVSLPVRASAELATFSLIALGLDRLFLAAVKILVRV